MDKPRFNIQMLAEARDFLLSLDDGVRREIVSDMKAAACLVNSALFKKLQGTDIWEFRTKAGGLQYRMLAFWDKTRKSMVIATHGFIKKTQKTPLLEIKKATKMMKQYYEQIGG